jgi:hypothetical protein
MMIVAVLGAGLACTLSSALPGSGDGDPAASPEDTAVQVPQGDSAGPAAAGSQDRSETGVPSQPVPFSQGLASLNSYRLSVNMESTGPTSFDQNLMSTVIANAADMDASHTQTRNVSSSEEAPEVYEETSEIYKVGNETCTYEAEEWAYEALEPVEEEVSQLFQSLVDFSPVIHNPALVGEENLNGVMTNHFQFQLTGLGSQSGALVTQSEGDYWLAQDGQYLVKYRLALELRNAPEGESEPEAVQASFTMELTDINQPISISLPADCLAARDLQQ